MRREYKFNTGDIVLCLDAVASNELLVGNSLYTVSSSGPNRVNIYGCHINWRTDRFKNLGPGTLTKLQKVIYEIT